MNPNQPSFAVNESETLVVSVFASLFVPALAGVAAKQNVSRQPSNSRGRKGTSQDPCGIQASHRREVWTAILHHKLGRKGCSSVSLRGMAADRRKASPALEFQSDQEEVFEPHQLLRPGCGHGRAGAIADAFLAARLSRYQRGSRSGRQPHLFGSAEHPALPKG